MLLERLTGSGTLHTPRIVAAFRDIDRADFVPAAHSSEAYADVPLPLGLGQTISQPSTVAIMLELLQPQRGQRMLDVGAGSGWTTALLACIADHEGIVVGVEALPALVEVGRANLAKYLFPFARIVQADGRVLGWPQEAPYDRILVSAAGTRLHESLVGQLADGGILVMPVGTSLWRVTRVAGETVVREEFPGFSFVPLRE